MTYVLKENEYLIEDLGVNEFGEHEKKIREFKVYYTDLYRVGKVIQLAVTTSIVKLSESGFISRKSEPMSRENWRYTLEKLKRKSSKKESERREKIMSNLDAIRLIDKGDGKNAREVVKYIESL